jgi:hypothetical protein
MVVKRSERHHHVGRQVPAIATFWLARRHRRRRRMHVETPAAITDALSRGDFGAAACLERPLSVCRPRYEC